MSKQMMNTAAFMNELHNGNQARAISGAASILQTTWNTAMQSLRQVSEKRTDPDAMVCSSTGIIADNSRVHLIAMGYSTSKTISIEAKVESPFSCWIETHFIADLVARLSPERIDLAYIPETNVLQIKCGTTTAYYKCPAIAESPVMPDAGNFKELFTVYKVKQFADYIDLIAGSSAKSDRPILQSIHLEYAPDSLIMTAANGYTLATMTLDSGHGIEFNHSDRITVNINAEQLNKALQKLAKNKNPHAIVVSISQDENGIRLDNGSETMNLINDTGRFPDYRRIIAERENVQEITFDLAAYGDYHARTKIQNKTKNYHLILTESSSTLTIRMSVDAAGDMSQTQTIQAAPAPKSVHWQITNERAKVLLKTLCKIRAIAAVDTAILQYTGDESAIAVYAGNLIFMAMGASKEREPVDYPKYVSFPENVAAPVIADNAPESPAEAENMPESENIPDLVPVVLTLASFEAENGYYAGKNGLVPLSRADLPEGENLPEGSARVALYNDYLESYFEGLAEYARKTIEVSGESAAFYALYQQLDTRQQKSLRTLADNAAESGINDRDFTILPDTIEALNPLVNMGLFTWSKKVVFTSNKTILIARDRGTRMLLWIIAGMPEGENKPAVSDASSTGANDASNAPEGENNSSSAKPAIHLAIREKQPDNGKGTIWRLFDAEDKYLYISGASAELALKKAHEFLSFYDYTIIPLEVKTAYQYPVETLHDKKLTQAIGQINSIVRVARRSIEERINCEMQKRAQTGAHSIEKLIDATINRDRLIFQQDLEQFRREAASAAPESKIIPLVQPAPVIVAEAAISGDTVTIPAYIVIRQESPDHWAAYHQNQPLNITGKNPDEVFSQAESRMSIEDFDIEPMPASSSASDAASAAPASAASSSTEAENLPALPVTAIDPGPLFLAKPDASLTFSIEDLAAVYERALAQEKALKEPLFQLFICEAICTFNLHDKLRRLPVAGYACYMWNCDHEWTIYKKHSLYGFYGGISHTSWKGLGIAGQYAHSLYLAYQAYRSGGNGYQTGQDAALYQWQRCQQLNQLPAAWRLGFPVDDDTPGTDASSTEAQNLPDAASAAPALPEMSIDDNSNPVSAAENKIILFPAQSAPAIPENPDQIRLNNPLVPVAGRFYYVVSRRDLRLVYVEAVEQYRVKYRKIGHDERTTSQDTDTFVYMLKQGLERIRQHLEALPPQADRREFLTVIEKGLYTVRIPGAPLPGLVAAKEIVFSWCEQDAGDCPLTFANWDDANAQLARWREGSDYGFKCGYRVTFEDGETCEGKYEVDELHADLAGYLWTNAAFLAGILYPLTRTPGVNDYWNKPEWIDEGTNFIARYDLNGWNKPASLPYQMPPEPPEPVEVPPVPNDFYSDRRVAIKTDAEKFPNTIRYSHTETAALMREELKKAFPGVKFSVKCRMSTHTWSIDTAWFDGPSDKEVRYLLGKFDASVSVHDGGDPYERGIDWIIDEKMRVSYTGSFRGYRRDYSTEFYTRVVTGICQQYGQPVPAITPASKDYGAHLKESNWNWANTGQTLSDLVWREIKEMSLTKPAATDAASAAPAAEAAPVAEISAPVDAPEAANAQPVADVGAGNIQAERVGDVWHISGDTRPVKEIIKTAVAAAGGSARWDRDNQRWTLHRIGATLPRAIADLLDPASDDDDTPPEDTPPTGGTRSTETAAPAAPASWGTWSGQPLDWGTWGSNPRNLATGATYRAPAPVPVNPAEVVAEAVNIPAPASPAPVTTPAAPKTVSIAGKLRQTAAGMQNAIDDKRAPRLANTHRRARFAASAEDDARYMELIQHKLNCLADLHEAGNCPGILAKLTSRAAVDELVKNNTMPSRRVNASRIKDLETYTNKRRTTHESAALRAWQSRTREHYTDIAIGEIELYRGLIKKATQAARRNLYMDDLSDYARLIACGIHEGNFSDARAALLALGEHRPDTSAADRLRQLERDIIGRKIPGYFPTPAPIVTRMVELAAIQPGESVLEPSAGKGSIADAVRDYAPVVIEVNGTLREILTEKGYTVSGYDFLDYTGQHDVILMNPPFENFQDVQHVRHAYERLNDGGRIVAIMCESPFFRHDRTAVEFRAWLDEIGGWSEKLPADAFKASDRPTGVQTRIVYIEKAA